MPMKTLYRRLGALERSRAITEETCNTKILNALHRISREHLELLIDATLARRRDRELTEGEAAAQQAYAAALQTECRGSGLTLRRIPDVPDLIFCAVTRWESLEDVVLASRALRAMTQGLEPTAEQLVALQTHQAAMQAQYQRIGFNSEAEFAEWHGVRPVSLGQETSDGEKRTNF